MVIKIVVGFVVWLFAGLTFWEVFVGSGFRFAVRRRAPRRARRAVRPDRTAARTRTRTKPAEVLARSN